MTASNFAALERLSALWQVLATHQDLPALVDYSYTAESNKFHVGLQDAAAVDAYGDAFGVGTKDHHGWLENSNGTWTYLRRSDSYLFIAREVAEPLPPQGVETAENSGPERVAVSS